MRNRRESDDAKAKHGFGDSFDEFVTAIPWGQWRMVLVHRRVHGCREYVRFRTWNKHRQRGCWYPSKRSFVIPAQHADALAQSLPAAVEGRFSRKPDWLISREQAEEETLQRLIDTGAPQEQLDAMRKYLGKRRKGRA